MLLGVNIKIYIITLDQLTISEYYNIIADEKWNKLYYFTKSPITTYLGQSLLDCYIVKTLKGHCGRDRMVVGFTTTRAISDYHH